MEQVQRLGRPLLYQEVPGVDGGAAHVDGPLGPDVERALRSPADNAVRAPDDQRGLIGAAASALPELPHRKVRTRSMQGAAS